MVNEIKIREDDRLIIPELEVKEVEEKDLINDLFEQILGTTKNEDTVVAHKLLEYGNNMPLNAQMLPLLDEGYTLVLEKANYKPNPDGTKSEEQAPMKAEFWFYIRLGREHLALRYWAFLKFIENVARDGLMPALTASY